MVMIVKAMNKLKEINPTTVLTGLRNTYSTNLNKENPITNA
jgi:hypothetical protein